MRACMLGHNEAFAIAVRARLDYQRTLVAIE
jgi:hypothetical protein